MELNRELESLIISETDAVAAAQPTSPHPGPPDSITSIADQSSKARQAQSLTRELDMDRDITNLPDVPSHSPSKTGTLETRQKTIHLC